MNASNVARLSAVIVVSVCACVALAQDEAKAPEIQVRKVDEQVVLYTLHRGDYDQVGQAIGRLFQIATEKGMKVTGGVSLAYLNNPDFVEKEHLLTEVRLTVDKDALKHAGKLGEFIDVKTVRAHKAAVATKPAGMADPSSIYEALLTWIRENGYIVLGGPCEKFLDGADKGDYAAMKTEISIPVAKVEEKD